MSLTLPVRPLHPRATEWIDRDRTAFATSRCTLSRPAILRGSERPPVRSKLCQPRETRRVRDDDRHRAQLWAWRGDPRGKDTQTRLTGITRGDGIQVVADDWWGHLAAVTPETQVPKSVRRHGVDVVQGSCRRTPASMVKSAIRQKNRRDPAQFHISKAQFAGRGTTPRRFVEPRVEPRWGAVCSAIKGWKPMSIRSKQDEPSFAPSGSRRPSAEDLPTSEVRRRPRPLLRRPMINRVFLGDAGTGLGLTGWGRFRPASWR